MATNYRSPFRDQFANLFEAILVGDDTDVRFLLENGADVNARDYNHITPLMLASWCGRLSMAINLLEHGASIDAASNNKMTALMWAVSKAHINVVDFLISKGANLDKQDIWGMSALMLATQIQSLELVEMLLYKGADPHLINKQGKCARKEALIAGKVIVSRVEKAQDTTCRP